MFLLVPAYPGCPGSKAVKWSLLVVVVINLLSVCPAQLGVFSHLFSIFKLTLSWAWSPRGPIRRHIEVPMKVFLQAGYPVDIQFTVRNTD